MKLIPKEYPPRFFQDIFLQIQFMNRAFAKKNLVKTQQDPHKSQNTRVKSLGGYFACLCRGFEFYEVKKNVIIFKKENGNTFTLFIIFIVKSLQKEQNSTNLLL